MVCIGRHVTPSNLKHGLSEYISRKREAVLGAVCDSIQSLEERLFGLTGSLCCVYCEKTVRKQNMDELFPCSKGGRWNRLNRVPACGNCNSSKSNKTGIEFESWVQKLCTVTQSHKEEIIRYMRDTPARYLRDLDFSKRSQAEVASLVDYTLRVFHEGASTLIEAANAPSGASPPVRVRNRAIASTGIRKYGKRRLVPRKAPKRFGGQQTDM